LELHVKGRLIPSAPHRALERRGESPSRERERERERERARIRERDAIVPIFTGNRRCADYQTQFRSPASPWKRIRQRALAADSRDQLPINFSG